MCIRDSDYRLSEGSNTQRDYIFHFVLMCSLYEWRITGHCSCVSQNALWNLFAYRKVHSGVFETSCTNFHFFDGVCVSLLSLFKTKFIVILSFISHTLQFPSILLQFLQLVHSNFASLSWYPIWIAYLLILLISDV